MQVTEHRILDFTGVELRCGSSFLYIEPVEPEFKYAGMLINNTMQVRWSRFLDCKYNDEQKISTACNLFISDKQKLGIPNFYVLSLVECGVKRISLTIKLPTRDYTPAASILSKLALKLSLIANFKNQSLIGVKVNSIYGNSDLDLSNEFKIDNCSYMFYFEYDGINYLDITNDSITTLNLYKNSHDINSILIDGEIIEGNLGYLVYNNDGWILIDKQQMSYTPLNLLLIDKDNITAEMIDNIILDWRDSNENLERYHQ